MPFLFGQKRGEGNMILKKIGAWMIALSMVSTMAACGAEKGDGKATATETESSSETTTEESEKTELELFMSKPETAEIMEQIAAKFCEENPGVKINVTSSSDGRTVLQTRLASDDVPDILNTFPAEDLYKNIFREGYIEEITDQEFLSKVNSDTLKISACDDKYYAVPMSVSTYGIYVNMDVLEANGITEAPSTWDELIADCKTLKDKGVTAFLMPNKDVGNVAQRFERTVGVINNDSYSEFKKIADGEMEAKDSPTLNAWVEYNTELLEYTNEDHMGMDYDIAVADFSNGKAAFMFSGTWMLSTVKENNPDANVKLIAFPNPTGGETKVPINIDTSFSISSTCKNKEIGLKFLEYMTQTDIAQMYCDVDGNVSLIEGVEYNVEQHKDMKTAVDSGNIFLTAVNFWPDGLREEIRPYCQQYLGDGDKEAFFEGAQDAIVTIYSDNE